MNVYTVWKLTNGCWEISSEMTEAPNRIQVLDDHNAMDGQPNNGTVKVRLAN